MGTLYSFPIRSLLELFAVYLSQLSLELIVWRCIDNLIVSFWVILGTLDLYLFQNRRVNCKFGVFITILELLCFHSELGSGLWAFKGQLRKLDCATFDAFDLAGELGKALYLSLRSASGAITHSVEAR